MTELDKKYQALILKAQEVAKLSQETLAICKEASQILDSIETGLTLTALERGYSWEEIERVKNGEKIR